MAARRCPLCSREIPSGATYCPYDGTRVPRSTARAGVVRMRGTRSTQSTGALLGGRYRIERFVDSGATARVYIGEDSTTKSTVALKIFAPKVAHGEQMRARFLRGARATMELHHPHVIRVLDTGIAHGGAPYVVLEPLVGATLGERLRKVEKLDPAFARRVTFEAASGLAAAHEIGVVHRDVKPDNIFLVRADDGSETVKVIDFGMAKVERTSASSSQGIVLGTIEYMAPEQIVSEHVDARSDVYGLGVVMYRMFTGHLPFDLPADGGDHRGKTLLGHQLFSPIPPPSWLDDALDPRIERVIVCATRKQPANRYPTMEALCRDLERIESGRKPNGQPLAVEPDVFEPASKEGRDAARFLSKELGFVKPRR